MPRAERGEPGSAGKAAERPDRRGPDQRRGILDQRRRNLALGLVAAVPERDEDVAHEAVAADPLDRRAGEAAAEGAVVERCQLGEQRQGERLARPEGELAAGRGELVPRADRQAVVAAIDAVADRRPQRARDVPLVLDRQVGDAAPRIELVGRREGLGGADVEAGPAGAAMVALRRVGRKIEVAEDGTEEQPRPEAPRHQVGVLALPAEPGALGQRLFHHRRGVDEDLDRGAMALLQPGGQPLQPRLDHVVIVAALGVDRDDPAIAVREPGERIAVRSVVEAEQDDALHVRPQGAGIAAAGCLVGQPGHVAMPAGGEEGVEPAGRSAELGRREPHLVEAEPGGLGADRLLHRIGIGHRPAHPRPR